MSTFQTIITIAILDFIICVIHFKLTRNAKKTALPDYRNNNPSGYMPYSNSPKYCGRYRRVGKQEQKQLSEIDECQNN